MLLNLGNNASYVFVILMAKKSIVGSSVYGIISLGQQNWRNWLMLQLLDLRMNAFRMEHSGCQLMKSSNTLIMGTYLGIQIFLSTRMWFILLGKKNIIEWGSLNNEIDTHHNFWCTGNRKTKKYGFCLIVISKGRVQYKITKKKTSI